MSGETQEDRVILGFIMLHPDSTIVTRATFAACSTGGMDKGCMANIGVTESC